MALEVPNWLAQRGGGLTRASTPSTWFVLINKEPQYSLAPVPVAGQFGCTITQTNNGRRVESKGTYASPEDALKGGLEDLRKALGW